MNNYVSCNLTIGEAKKFPVGTRLWNTNLKQEAVLDSEWAKMLATIPDNVRSAFRSLDDDVIGLSMGTLQDATHL